MNNKQMIENLLSVSLVKTALFNIRYFGWAGVKLPVIISRQTKLLNLKGSVVLHKPKLAGIKIGFGTATIFDRRYTRVVWDNSGEIVFDGSAVLGYGTKITNGGRIEFGDNFKITANSSLICRNEIVFGKDVLLSWDIQIMDSDWHKILDEKGNTINPDGKIFVGDHVWICSKAVVLKGTHIEEGSIVAAGAIIGGEHKTKNTLIAGKDKEVKYGILWKS